MPVTIGRQLGSYEITALLGKGGMGEVYRARDTKLKREVAIKILPDEFSRDPSRVSRFQREAEVLASLNHPNIAAIYDLEETGETRFLGISWIRADGGGEVQSLLPGSNTPSSFSPDGTRLAYYSSNPGTGGDIWMLPLDVSDPDHPKQQKPEVFLNSPISENLPAFSPDGHWIAYRTSGESGEQALWVRRYPDTGARWQISTDAFITMWSRTAQ